MTSKAKRHMRVLYYLFFISFGANLLLGITAYKQNSKLVPEKVKSYTTGCQEQNNLLLNALEIQADLVIKNSLNTICEIGALDYEKSIK